MRFRGLWALFFALFLSESRRGELSAAVYKKAELRRILLERSRERPQSTIKVIYPEAMSPRARAFIEYFQNEIWDEYEKAQVNFRLSGLWEMGLSEAWYRNEGQKKEWERNMASALRQVRRQQRYLPWFDKVRKWARMSRGLQGALPDFARAFASGLPEEPPSLESQKTESKLDAVEAKIDRAWNELPDAELEAPLVDASTELFTRYSAGELSLEDAVEAYEKVADANPGNFADAFLAKAGKWMNEAAVLRSRQAKENGHATWARWQSYSWSENFDSELSSIGKLRRFLVKALKDNEEEYIFMLRRRLGIYADAPSYELTAAHLEFLVVSDFTVEEHLEGIDSVTVWKKLLRASGFGEQCFDETVIDCQARKNKSQQTEMMPLEPSRPRQLLFDGRLNELSPVYPNKDRSESWHRAESYIFANFGDGVLSDLRQLLHEGAHALDYFFRTNPFSFEASTAYTEVWPALFERLLVKEDFIRSLSRRQTDDQALRTYLAEQAALEIFNFRRSVARALTELEVWDYDYDQAGAESFVDRSLRLFGEHLQKALKLTSLGGTAVANSWRKEAFGSTHIFSGQVDYAAYPLAEIVAKALETHLQDRVWRKGGGSQIIGRSALR